MELVSGQYSAVTTYQTKHNHSKGKWMPKMTIIAEFMRQRDKSYDMSSHSVTIFIYAIWKNKSPSGYFHHPIALHSDCLRSDL